MDELLEQFSTSRCSANQAVLTIHIMAGHSLRHSMEEVRKSKQIILATAAHAECYYAICLNAWPYICHCVHFSTFCAVGNTSEQWPTVVMHLSSCCHAPILTVTMKASDICTASMLNTNGLHHCDCYTPSFISLNLRPAHLGMYTAHTAVYAVLQLNFFQIQVPIATCSYITMR